MNFYQLGFRYLIRKKSKTMILMMIFVLIGSMILCTSTISRATEESKMLIQEKTGSKVMIEIEDEKDKITEEEMQRVTLLDGVASINRQSRGTAFINGCMPVTGSESTEDDNFKATVCSFDDLQNDSVFYEQRYRLIKGNYIERTTVNGIVINLYFAEANGLNIGDKIELQAEDGKRIFFEIIGLFTSGSESRQPNETLAVNRIENQMFIGSHAYLELLPDSGFYKASVYVRNPEEMKHIEDELSDIFYDRVAITTSDTLFQQMKAPLEQILSIVRIMFFLTFVTGTVIVTIILCMWMRTRKKETSIFVSIGKSKRSILLQVILEAFGVFFISMAGACVIGNFMARIMKELLLSSQTADITLSISLTLPDIGLLFAIGSSIVFIAVAFSMFPILKANPKDVLSRMEG
ncbi:MAG: ABC transporter permease [Lachnospiraceae bacterium]|nr:ABC transporter permease [Lachnospiraceae bacterium]MDE6253407.1 ABC transporter permease [Lachnospiraceae bacterium]